MDKIFKSWTTLTFHRPQKFQKCVLPILWDGWTNEIKPPKSSQHVTYALFNIDIWGRECHSSLFLRVWIFCPSTVCATVKPLLTLHYHRTFEDSYRFFNFCIFLWAHQTKEGYRFWVSYKYHFAGFWHLMTSNIQQHEESSIAGFNRWSLVFLSASTLRPNASPSCRARPLLCRSLRVVISGAKQSLCGCVPSNLTTDRIVL